MARSAILKPVYRKDRALAGFSAYMVNVPPPLSPTGKRQQLFFHSKGEALTACEELKARRHNFGISLTTLSSDRIIEASKAYKILDGLGVSLLNAVEQFAAIHTARTKSVTWKAMMDEYMPTLADRSPDYIKSMRIALHRYPDLFDRMVCDITHKDLESLMATDPRGHVTNGARRTLTLNWSAFLNYGIRQGYLQENPVKRLNKVQSRKKEVEVIAVDNVQAMLNDALENDLELLPMLLFGFFCGIRPDGEIQRMHWSTVGLYDSPPQLTMKPEWTKKNKRRFVDFEPNMIAWIEAYKMRGGKTEGKIVPWRDSTMRKHRSATRKRTGVTHWPNSAARHSYCSYWLAKNHDVNKLVLQSGHDDADIMWRNYHRGITEAEAERYWNIMPPAAPSNVVPMSAVASTVA
jgi:integrase